MNRFAFEHNTNRHHANHQQKNAECHQQIRHVTPLDECVIWVNKPFDLVRAWPPCSPCSAGDKPIHTENETDIHGLVLQKSWAFLLRCSPRAVNNDLPVDKRAPLLTAVWLTISDQYFSPSVVSRLRLKVAEHNALSWRTQLD
ncbi:hypothetical protein [Vibrio vulnificus YJ016]|uniref:Uncharacterized protein n=1 Tax=Vibrio vulnificus (strain YJ016) TaxID=196600 RepID=Q7MCF3_VIBVY|nr:hypothetical protein [Vibrio vulnificus YJ016]